MQIWFLASSKCPSRYFLTTGNNPSPQYTIRYKRPVSSWVQRNRQNQSGKVMHPLSPLFEIVGDLWSTFLCSVTAGSNSMTLQLASVFRKTFARLSVRLPVRTVVYPTPATIMPPHWAFWHSLDISTRTHFEISNISLQNSLDFSMSNLKLDPNLDFMWYCPCQTCHGNTFCLPGAKSEVN